MGHVWGVALIDSRLGVGLGLIIDWGLGLIDWGLGSEADRLGLGLIVWGLIVWDKLGADRLDAGEWGWKVGLVLKFGGW